MQLYNRLFLFFIGPSVKNSQTNFLWRAHKTFQASWIMNEYCWYLSVPAELKARWQHPYWSREAHQSVNPHRAASPSSPIAIISQWKWKWGRWSQRERGRNETDLSSEDRRVRREHLRILFIVFNALVSKYPLPEESADRWHRSVKSIRLTAEWDAGFRL